MTPARHDTAQFASNGMALVLTIAMWAVLLAVRPDAWRDSLVASTSAGQPGIAVSLEQAPAEIPPAPPPPVPHKVPVHKVMPVQPAMAEIPVPAQPEFTPVDNDSVPEGGALVAASAGAAPASDYRPDLNAQYAAGLRSDIDRRTRPPNSAQYRLHRPFGEVRVSFIVTRDGEPKAACVTRSSGSPILDDAAVAIVSSGHYAPMPAKVFAGEAQHVFAVTIEFRAPS